MPRVRICWEEVTPVFALLPPGSSLPRDHRDAKINRTVVLTPDASLYEITAFFVTISNLANEFGGSVFQYFRRGIKTVKKSCIVEIDNFDPSASHRAVKLVGI